MKKVNEFDWNQNNLEIAKEMTKEYLDKIDPLIREFRKEYGQFLGGWQIIGLDATWIPFPNFSDELIDRYRSEKLDSKLFKDTSCPD